jgi:uncharacterized protein YaiE (UPF0345 family)
MTESLPRQFDNVSVVLKGNVYFEGRVISHTILFPDGTKKTIGTINHGGYKFDTGAPERMEIISGACRVRIAGEEQWHTFEGGSFFEVPGHSSFEITVAEGVCEYVCSFRAEKA